MDESIYPIGKYTEQPISETLIIDWLLDIKFLASSLEHAVLNLDEYQLNTSYREDGWSIKQIVHHLADSHMNAFIRCKLALTEENPTIKPYNQDDWAIMPDVIEVPINVSITLLHALHQRLHVLLSNVTDSQWNNTLHHPEYNRQMSLWFVFGLYAWHGKHHVAQIQALRTKMNWQ